MTRNNIGIIQGRLSKSVDGKIQAFPWDTWQNEFALARQAGLASIEFIFEQKNYQHNPLLTAEGQQEIKRLVAQTGVTVDHVIADYFMEQPLIRVDESTRQSGLELLKRLIVAAHALGIRGIEIPLVDNSALNTDEEKETVIRAVSSVLPLAEEHGVEIGFETSLPPQPFVQFLKAFNHPLVRANYDIGNSAALGYDTTEEITALGTFISNVHIKDRVFGGTTVALGSGNARLKDSFVAFKAINYAGPFILQVARGAEGNEVNDAIKNAAVIKNLIDTYLTR